MMLASPLLRVVPVTVHASLRDSIAMLTTEMIVAAVAHDRGGVAAGFRDRARRGWRWRG